MQARVKERMLCGGTRKALLKSHMDTYYFLEEIHT